jgi:hypothetical protein
MDQGRLLFEGRLDDDMDVDIFDNDHSLDDNEVKVYQNVPQRVDGCNTGPAVSKKISEKS